MDHGRLGGVAVWTAGAVKESGDHRWHANKVGDSAEVRHTAAPSPNMTDPEATPETPVPPGQVDLSDLRMMPAWVAGMGGSSNFAKYE
jgi:hypothetical protein